MGLLPQGDSKRGHVGAVRLTGSGYPAQPLSVHFGCSKSLV
jgi:hypothetical protein